MAMTGREQVVSIGSPVYNGENFVGETIECCLRQTFKDYEIIVSDDGSPDATGSICRELGWPSDWWIDYDQGLFERLNDGLFVHSDRVRVFDLR